MDFSDLTESLGLLAQSLGVPIVFIVLLSSTMLGLRRHAKGQGRSFPDNRAVLALVNSRAPFSESRLNEPFDLIRRYRPLVSIALIAVAFSGVATRSMAVFYGFVLLGCFAIVSKRLYVEACIAFGAETAPAPERADTPAPIPGT